MWAEYRETGRLLHTRNGTFSSISYGPNVVDYSLNISLLVGAVATTATALLER